MKRTGGLCPYGGIWCDEPTRFPCASRWTQTCVRFSSGNSRTSPPGMLCRTTVQSPAWPGWCGPGINRTSCQELLVLSKIRQPRAPESVSQGITGWPFGFGCAFAGCSMWSPTLSLLPSCSLPSNRTNRPSRPTSTKDSSPATYRTPWPGLVAPVVSQR